VCVCSAVDNELTVVSEIEPGKLSQLHTLELRGNRLTSLAGLCLPTLKNLYLVSLTFMPIFIDTFMIITA